MSKSRLFFLVVGLLGGLLVLLAASTAGAQCLDCHAGVAANWEQSTMSPYLECADCHGTQHDSATNADLVQRATPKVCAECHEEQVTQFTDGKHALGFDALAVVPNYKAIPSVAGQAGCEGCHKVGYNWPDGSKGSCDSCHARHTFSVAEALEPEACGNCHSGDHPQFELYDNSKHGKFYGISGNSERYPTCQTCHMSDGDHKAITAWGFIGYRPAFAGETPEEREVLEKVKAAITEIGPAKAPGVYRESYEEWAAEREKMLDTCTNCHSRSFAQRRIAMGDEMIMESSKVFVKIYDLTNQMSEEGLIDNMTKNSIMREALAHRFSSYMGTFHGAHEAAWDEGYLALSDDLIHTRDTMIQLKKLEMIKDKMGSQFTLSAGAALLSILGLTN